MKHHAIAYLPGDGIGPEVMWEARQCLDAAGARFGFSLKWSDYPFGAGYYQAEKVALPAGALGEFAGHDAMLLGAIGDPRVPPGILEQEILLTLRFHFDQYVNLRPAQAYPGIKLPVELPAGEKMDVVVVRENTEDFYMGLGGVGTGAISGPVRAKRGLYELRGEVWLETADAVETAFSLGCLSRPAVERITRYAARLVSKRGEKKLTVVSKANAVPHLYGFWDRVVKETLAGEFPDLSCQILNVDALCYHLVRKPWGWGVLLCPNLFGDIVSDLLSGLAGGLGMAAAGNIGAGLSMFEPVHGSAPDIAGRDAANPLAGILSGAMLLRHIGEAEAAAALEEAVRGYLHAGIELPLEVGGGAGTGRVGELVRQRLLTTKS